MTRRIVLQFTMSVLAVVAPVGVSFAQASLLDTAPAWMRQTTASVQAPLGTFVLKIYCLFRSADPSCSVPPPSVTSTNVPVAPHNEIAPPTSPFVYTQPPQVVERFVDRVSPGINRQDVLD